MAGGLGIRGVHHIGVSVPDLALARRFYIDILGGIEDSPGISWRDNAAIDAVIGLRGSAADMFLVRIGNTRFEVFRYLAPAASPQDPDRGVHQYGYTHFAVQVDDVMACYERLLAAGLTAHAPPIMEGIVTRPDGSKTGYAASYCRDFFGNVFEIIEIHANDEIPSL